MVQSYKKLLPLVFFFCFQSLYSQVYWGNKAGGPSVEQGLAVTCDALGNTYATGYFTGICTFGATVLNSTGLSDIFVAKYDNQGVLLWARKYGGATDERARGIALDGNGNILLTGHFTGSTLIGSVGLTSSGLDDVLTCKLDNNGNVLWARSGGGAGPDLGHDVTSDASGNVIVTGEIRNSATFGSSVLNGINEDVFIVKYDASGNQLWTQLGTGNFADRGYGITSDASGNIYICGPFAETITFDQAHTNPLTNVSFLVKFDPAGNEVWFRYMGGGSLCTANDLDILSGGSQIYVTGDFTGNMTFFGTPLPALTNTYANRIFIASYDLSGNGTWSRADGSDSPLSCRTVEATPTGAVIAGHFKCTLDDYADVYGAGAFNSVGFYDCFITEYSSSGQRTRMRQWGGNKNDFCWDLGFAPGYAPVTIGDFEGKLNIPVQPASLSTMYNTDLTFCGAIYQTAAWCGDNNYNSYARFLSAGNYDMFVGGFTDWNREPYDFYERFGSGCSRPQVEPCIQGTSFYNCPDTIEFCGNGSLGINSYANANSCIGPEYTYSFSPTNFFNITSSNIYTCTTTRADGCYGWTDSIYVVIHPRPPVPPISDEVPVNIADDTTSEIQICADSVLIWGAAQGYSAYQWVGGTAMDTSFMVTANGSYTYLVSDANGCTRQNTVDVLLDDPVVPLSSLGSYCPDDTDMNDTVRVCIGDALGFDIYDTVSMNSIFPEWGGTYELYYPGNPVPVTDTIVTHVPDVPFVATTTGWYTVVLLPTQSNACDTVLYTLTDSIYVRVDSLPDIALAITPSTATACFGDTVIFVGTSSIPGVSINWYYGPEVIAISNDTAFVVAPGGVYIDAIYTDSLGCTAQASASGYVSEPSPPVISVSPSFICPGDSVLLICNATGAVASWQWYGPEGPLTVSNDSLYTDVPGFYYCAVLDTHGCYLYSNTVEIQEYLVPDLFATPDMICPAQDTAVLHISAGLGSTIQWLAPLSGSDTVMFVTAPGTYYCQFTTCGVTVTDSVVIRTPNSSINIFATGSTFFCYGDSVLLTATGSTGVGAFSWQPAGSSGNPVWVYETATYTATGTDSLGCEVVSNGIDVEANSNTIPPPAVEDVEFCAPGPVTFQASAQGQVFWYDSLTSVTPLLSGTSFTTGILTGTTSFFTEQLLDSCFSERIEIKAVAIECDTIVMPNAFSPDGDGINDYISFFLLDATCFDIYIYNRWGYAVYHSDDHTQPWYGLSETGEPLAGGVYFYVLRYCPKNLPQKTSNGFLHLFK